MVMGYEEMIAEATEIPRDKLSQHTNCEGCGIKIDLVYNHSGHFINPFNKDDTREYNATQCLICGQCNKWKVYRKKKFKEDESGECGKCKGKVVLQQSSGKNRHKKQYYYTHYFQCTKCKTIYMDDKYKVMN